MSLEYRNKADEQLSGLIEESHIKKVQEIQKFFDRFEDQPEKQKAVLAKFGRWLNESPEVQKLSAKMLYEQCMDAEKAYEYRFNEWPHSLIDLLDKFVKEV